MVKRLWAVLCSVLWLWLMCIPVMAQEIELNVSIPSEHTVTINSTGGRIVSEGKVCGEQILGERQNHQVYTIIPNPGKVLKCLLYDGVDVTEQIKNNRFTAPELVRDAVLTAEFKDAPATPDENRYVISGNVVDKNGEKIPGAIVEIGGIMETTGEDGNFKIEGLPSGVHPVVIKDKEGNILGYVSITIDGQSNKDLVLTVDENGNPVLIPKYGTEEIYVVFMLTGDGDIRISNAEDRTIRASNVLPTNPQQPTNPQESSKNQKQTEAQESVENQGLSNTKSPKTGDYSQTVLWLLLAVLGATCVAAISARKMQRF